MHGLVAVRIGRNNEQLQQRVEPPGAELAAVALPRLVDAAYVVGGHALDVQDVAGVVFPTIVHGVLDGREEARGVLVSDAWGVGGDVDECQ